jgi:hypothetical protein
MVISADFEGIWCNLARLARDAKHIEHSSISGAQIHI